MAILHKHNNNTLSKLKRSRKALLMSGSVLLGLSAISPAYAQDSSTASDGQEAEDDTIVVRGVRRSIKSAQDIKQNADTFVDAVTAEDIGALSDRSIAEALTRVPGVAVSNFSGPNDPDHFSIEGSGVVIRGLTLTRSEVNGRDIFTTGLGRSIDFQDFPSELVSAIEVYKNNSADQVEGGLAGTVNLVTRKPFDSQGRIIAGSLEFNHSDLQDIQTVTPGGSLLFSDRWNTDFGEIGVLVSGSFSRLVNESNATQIGVSTLFDGGFFPSPTVDGASAIQADVIDGVFGGTLPNAIPDSTFHIVGGGVRNEERERERYGFDAALQWRSPDERTTATFEFLRTDATLSWAENVVEPVRDSFNRPPDPDGLFPAVNGTGGVAVPIDPSGAILEIAPGQGIAVPTGGTFLELNDSGQFEAGVLTSAGSGWRGVAAVAPGSFVNFGGFGQPGLGFIDTTLINAPQQLTVNRGRDEDSDVSNYTFNLQHEFTDRYRADFDFQYIRSNNEVFDGAAAFSFFANSFLDLNDGGIPEVRFLPGANPNLGVEAVLPDSEGNFTAAQEAEIGAFLTNPDNFFFRSLLRFIEDSDTDEFAIASNHEYDVEHDWITSFKFGGRYSDRSQIARATIFDFSFVNEIFGGQETFSIAELAALGSDPDSAAFGINAEALVETFDFQGLQRGNIANPGAVLFPGDFFRSNGSVPGSPLQDVVDEISAIFTANGNIFSTLANRNLADDGVDDIIPGTPFRVGEITTSSESIISFYGLAKFENGPISGNLGLRWVRTNVSTDGSQTQDNLPGVTQADIDASLLDDEIPDIPQEALGTPVSCLDAIPDGVDTGANPNLNQNSGICVLPVADQITLVNFLDGSSQPLSTSVVSDIFLPSLNVKYDLGDGKLLRFAASRTISRPDFGLFRNNQLVSQDTAPDGGVRIRADGGNAFLQPVTSINLDGSFEWYFSDAGSFTVSGFWKRLNGIIQQGETVGPPLTANGITFEDTEIIGPANIADGTIRGAELAYRQFYDFLPGPFSNLGFEGTYTFVDQSAIPTTAPLVAGGGGDSAFADVNTQFNGPASNIFPITQIEGLSRHTINATAIYENDFVSARLAYNWRSRFLLTQRDVGLPFPALPVFNEAQGSLDGSIFFNVSENVKFGIQAVNLTNRVIETTQQINEAGDVAPRSFFINDRRFTAAMRFNF